MVVHGRNNFCDQYHAHIGELSTMLQGPAGRAEHLIYLQCWLHGIGDSSETNQASTEALPRRMGREVR